jgi:hypothetical protein
MFVIGPALQELRERAPPYFPCCTSASPQ